MEKEGKATNDPSAKETNDGWTELEGKPRAAEQQVVHDCEDERSRVKCE